MNGRTGCPGALVNLGTGRAAAIGDQPAISGAPLGDPGDFPIRGLGDFAAAPGAADQRRLPGGGPERELDGLDGLGRGPGYGGPLAHPGMPGGPKNDNPAESAAHITCMSKPWSKW
jgi:hypothetical protein